jgi:hypothetical protein
MLEGRITRACASAVQTKPPLRGFFVSGASQHNSLPRRSALQLNLHDELVVHNMPS